MALDFEEQTPKSIYERSASDIKLAAPKSNPTNVNSFLYGLVKTIAFRIFDFYQQQKKLKAEIFPDTSSVDGELARWASYKKIFRGQVTGSEGQVIASGILGSVVPKGELATLGEITFETTSEVTINTTAYALVSLSRNGTTVTATTASGHNLAAGLEMVIAGANEEIFNGTYNISTTTATTFTYQVDSDDQFETATGSISATFEIGFVPVRVSDDSVESGAKTNLSVGTSVTFANPQGYDADGLVSYNGLSGGADLEDPESFRSRVLEAYRNPIANFNVSALQQVIINNVNNATRVYVKQTFPEIGQVTIYFVCDNTGVIPTGQDVVEAREAVLSIKDVTTPSESVFVLSPNPLYIDFTFTRIVPATTEMRKAITDRLKELFSTDANVEQDLASDAYRSKISTTVDATGARLQSFTLAQPIGDIRVTGQGEIPVLRNVTFDTSFDDVYIEQMFDGQDGRSNGTNDGASKEITGDNISVDIFVQGNFDGADVTLQEYSDVLQNFVNTSVVFTTGDSFTGLFVSEGERFRLVIANADANTSLVSEVKFS